MMKAEREFAYVCFKAAQEYGFLKSFNDMWHNLRTNATDEGGPLKWTKSVIRDLHGDDHNDASVLITAAQLWLMFGTPYGVSAILFSALPSVFRKRDESVRKAHEDRVAADIQKYADRASDLRWN